MKVRIARSIAKRSRRKLIVAPWHDTGYHVVRNISSNVHGSKISS